MIRFGETSCKSSIPPFPAQCGTVASIELFSSENVSPDRKLQNTLSSMGSPWKALLNWDGFVQ